MRILLSIILLLFSSAILAQKPVETVIAIKKGSKYQFVNRQTRIAVDNNLWDDAQDFVNGFARVSQARKFSLVDGSAKLITPLEFDDARNFSNNLCAVNKAGKWGFINASGKLSIPFNYEIAFDFTHPVVTVVCANKKWYLLNNKGAIIKQLDITGFYGFSDGIATIVKEDKVGTLYPDGTIIFGKDKFAVNKPINWQPPVNNLAVPCPDNLGFEFGDFTNWECFIGDVAAVNDTNVITVSPSPPITGRHTIIPRQTISLRDRYGDFEINSPNGSNFAVKLGDTITGAQSERIRYTIHVPLNDSTFSLKYDYAVVFENPLTNHQLWEQPRFVSRLIDSATGNAINCASLEFVATSGLPGFEVSPIPSNHGDEVLFKPWSSVVYGLKGYGGQTLYLEFTTADCTRSGHWGYAYVDVHSTCGAPVEIQYDCVAPNEMTLTAPPGFQAYNWWNSNFSTLLGTGQQLYMNPGLPLGSSVWVEIVPYSGLGCLDTMLIELDGTFDAQFDLVDPGGCGAKTYTFYNRNIPSISTTWDFGDGNTATGDTVTHTYSIPGSYQVTMDVVMPGGCIGNDINLITIYPPPNMASPVDQVFCNGEPSSDIIFTGTPPGVVFNWTNSDPSIGIPASGSGNIASFTPVNTTNAPVTATIIVTPAHLTCTGTPDTFRITVNPSPDMVTPPVNQVVCNGTSSNPVTFIPTLSGTTFNWANNAPSIGLSASGTGDIPSFTAINTGTIPITATITVTPTDGGICQGIVQTFTIRVNPTPDVVQPANQTFCPGSATTAINFTGAVSGTIYNWTNNNPSIGLPASGTGDIPSFTPVNNSSVPQSGFITVTPVADGCPGPVKYFTLTINPMPTVLHPGNQSVCNGASTSTINFSGAVGATFFVWANDNTSIGLGPSGNGDIPSFTAINTGNVPAIANINVLPIAYGCPGTLQSFTITVNPTPDMAIPANQALCNGTATSAINFTGSVSGTNFTWSNNNPSIGLAASGAGDIPPFTATNITTAPVIATISVLPTANGCPGTAQGFTITVVPTPDVAQPIDQSLCNGATTNAIDFAGSVTNTAFTWTNNNTSIGLAASGTGNIPSFMAINTTNAPVTATITVTPSVFGCTGVAKSFIIIVNPTPDMAQPANQSLCNGSATNAVNFTGSVNGTSFTWSNNNPSIGLAASGAGDIPSFTAGNSTNAPIIATISVVPLANGCFGAAKGFTITVLPTPDVVQPPDQTLCNGAATNTVNFTGAVSGTSFNWINNNTSIGLAASGTGDIPSFTAINTTNAPVTATITVTPSVFGCTGVAQSFIIIVNPTPDVAIPANQVLCNGSATNSINLTGAVSGTSFGWNNNNPSIGLAANGVGDIPSFTAINTTNTPVTATISVTPSANSCPGNPVTFTITVNPTPDMVKPANQVLCNDATTNAVNFTGTVSGTGFNWTNDNTSIGLAASGTGDIPAFTAINTTNAAVTATITVSPLANSCPGPSQSFTITVNPTPDVVQPADQRICDGLATNTINFSGSVSGTNFNWINSEPSIGLSASGAGSIPSFNGINPGPSPVTGTITVTPVAKGCTGLPKTVTVTVDPNPIIELGNDLHLSTGTTVTLNSTIQNGPISNWAWTPVMGLSCTDCASPVLTVANAITYNVVVTNVYGCIARDNISVSSFCTDGQVFFPNAFTPDGNGLNDVFLVSGKGFSIKNLRIFARWGELVFQKSNFRPDDKLSAWNGKIKEKGAPQGVYVFIAELVCDNGTTYAYKGTVTLLR